MQQSFAVACDILMAVRARQAFGFISIVKIGDPRLLSAESTAQGADQPAADHQKPADWRRHRKERALRHGPQSQIATKEKRAQDDEGTCQSGEACRRAARQRHSQRRMDERKKGSRVQGLAIATMGRNGSTCDASRAKQACEHGQDSVGQAEKVGHGITRVTSSSGNLRPRERQAGSGCKT